MCTKLKKLVIATFINIFAFTPFILAMGSGILFIDEEESIEVLRLNRAQSPQEALFEAIATRNVQQVKTALNNGANVNEINRLNAFLFNETHTPLMAASVIGHKKIVQTLLDHKADTNLKNSENNTALLLNINSPHYYYDIIKLLLGAGANPFIKNDQDKKAIDIARKKNRSIALKTLEEAENSRNDLRRIHFILLRKTLQNTCLLENNSALIVADYAAPYYTDPEYAFLNNFLMAEWSRIREIFTKKSKPTLAPPLLIAAPHDASQPQNNTPSDEDTKEASDLLPCITTNFHVSVQNIDESAAAACCTQYPQCDCDIYV